jgi:hypothetical protein
MDPVAAEGFRRAADAYERGRPAYPFEAVAWLVEALRIGPDTTVVDVGAGTGKFTAQLVPTGATTIAVEPIDAMRATLAAHLPTVVALSGAARSASARDGPRPTRSWRLRRSTGSASPWPSPSSIGSSAPAAVSASSGTNATQALTGPENLTRLSSRIGVKDPTRDRSGTSSSVICSGPPNTLTSATNSSSTLRRSVIGWRR